MAEVLEPRFIIPRVSGYAELNRILYLDGPNSNFYLAGQAAPAPGLEIHGNRTYFDSAEQILIRHITHRTGTKGDPESGFDCMTFVEMNQVEVDHVSLTWGLDEMLDFDQGELPTDGSAAVGKRGIVVSHTLIAEGINGHNTGSLCGNTGFNNPPYDAPSFEAEYMLNLFESVGHRTPNMATPNHGGSFVRAVNNVVSNNGNRLSNAIGNSVVDMINVYYKAGNDNPILFPDNLNVWQRGTSAGGPWVPSIYCNGSIVEGEHTEADDDWATWLDFYSREPLPTSLRRSTPIAVTPETSYTPMSATDAYQYVVVDGEVGANRFAGSDGLSIVRRKATSLDGQMLQRIQDGTTPAGHSTFTIPQFAARLPAQESGVPYVDADHDGIADAWELEHGLDPTNGLDYAESKVSWTLTLDDGATATVSNTAGYLNLEIYLAWLGGDFDTLRALEPGKHVAGPGSPTTSGTTVASSTMLSGAGGASSTTLASGLDTSATGAQGGSVADGTSTTPGDSDTLIIVLVVVAALLYLTSVIFGVLWRRSASRADGERHSQALGSYGGKPEMGVKKPPPLPPRRSMGASPRRSRHSRSYN
jgi:hypothetical protein